MAGQLGHEALAEAHHFIVGFPFGVEVGTALSAAHGQRGQAVLEDLLEAEKLQDAQVDRWVEAQTAFVRTDGRIELDAVALVDLHLSAVIGPRHTEHDGPFGFNHAFQDAVLRILRVVSNERNDGLCNFLHRLNELGFIRILSSHFGHEGRNLLVVRVSHQRTY